MSRRSQAPVRVILPDPKYSNLMLAKFMNVIMKSGKKSAAERIIYGALDRIAEKTGKKGTEAIADDGVNGRVWEAEAAAELKARYGS